MDLWRQLELDGRCEGAIELIVAIFRLAVADYLGHSYSHDGCAPTRRTKSRFRPHAAAFLSGPWAAFLADQIGLDSTAIWREVKRLEQLSSPTAQPRIAA